MKVNTDTGTRNQANPAISTDSSSNAYAVWDDFRDGTNNQNIYYSKRLSSTGLWSTPNLKVNDGTGNTNERNPRIAGTAAGTQTAVWVDLRSSQNNIYSSQLPAGGSAWPANKKVTDNTSALKDFPDVAVDSANTAYAVWQDSRNGYVDVFFSSLASGAANWAANVKISDDPGTAGQTKPRIGVDSAGNLTAAWIDARTSPAHVRVARKPSGGAWSASIDISPSPANVQSLALSVRPDGFAWAVWGDTRAGASNQDIWGSRYDPNPGTWSAPVRLDDDPGTSANQLSPAVAFAPAEVMLAWRDNRLSANGDTQARRVQVISGMTDHFALSYDGLNRLKSVVGPVSETFTLDGPSNITARTGPAQTDSYDLANRLTSDGSQSYTWSDADRLTNRGTDTFGYDALDRMTSSAISGIGRTYTYNGDGILQTRTGGVSANFLWDPGSAPMRLLKQGSDLLVYGLGPLYAVKADTTTLTFARDASKNMRAEVLASGSVAASFRYRGYGQIAQTTSSGPTYLGFASQLVDPSGLLYMRARWYDPTSQRFLSHDPLGGGDPTDPGSLNGYNYGALNPISLVDPTGLAATTGTESAGGKCDWLCLTRDRLLNSPPDNENQDPCFAATGPCTYYVSGGPTGTVEVRNNADDFLSGIVGVVGLIFNEDHSWNNTMTFGPDLIVSTVNVSPRGPTLAHELGHTVQARAMGALYLPGYAALAWGENHDTHPMERDANRRAQLPLAWDGYIPVGWVSPYNLHIRSTR